MKANPSHARAGNKRIAAQASLKQSLEWLQTLNDPALQNKAIEVSIRKIEADSRAVNDELGLTGKAADPSNVVRMADGYENIVKGIERAESALATAKLDNRLHDDAIARRDDLTELYGAAGLILRRLAEAADATAFASRRQVNPDLIYAFAGMEEISLVDLRKALPTVYSLRSLAIAMIPEDGALRRGNLPDPCDRTDIRKAYPGRSAKAIDRVYRKLKSEVNRGQPVGTRTMTKRRKNNENTYAYSFVAQTVHRRMAEDADLYKE